MVEVVLVIPYTNDPMGGVEHVACNIMEGLIKCRDELINRNLQITVLSDAEKRNHSGYRIFKDTNVRVFFYKQLKLPTLTGDMHHLIMLKTCFKHLISSAHIVHSHNILFSLPLAIFSMKKVRIIHTFHGLPWNELKLLTSSLGKIPYEALNLRLKLLSRLPSVEFVAISRYVFNEVRTKLRINEQRIHIIPDPVSEEFFNVKKNEIPGTMFYPARLIPRKNHLTLLKALRILKTKGLRDFKLVLTGRPEDRRYFNLLISTIQRYDLSSNVILSGVIDKTELKKLYSIASIAIVPSFEETFSLTVAEAMATGTPVLSSPTGLATDEITDFKNGVLINPLDPYDIAEKIRILIEDDKLRRQIGIEAEKTANKWRSSNVARRLIKLWCNHE